MSSKTNSKNRGGREWEEGEYLLLFNLKVAGIPDYLIARILRRPISAVEAGSRRLMFNASAYRYQKTYELCPLFSGPFNWGLNRWTKSYIRQQHFDSRILATVGELAMRIGCEEKDIIKVLERTK